MQMDVSGSVNCFRTSNTDASDTSSLSLNHFQTESQNSVCASPKSDSTCLTRHSIADAAAKNQHKGSITSSKAGFFYQTSTKGLGNSFGMPYISPKYSHC
jgi:hypothetical protein